MSGGASSAATGGGGRPPFGVGLPGNRWDLLDGQLPDALPTVSVIVVHYEQQAELDRTLAALARQSYPAELLEIVVVDDGSATAPAMSHGARLVRQADEGFRLAAARNLGVASSSGDILCFLDADTAPEPGYVASITRLPALAPETVAVGRRRHTSFDAIDSSAPIEAVAPDAAMAEPRWLADAYRDSRNLLESDNRSYRFVIGAVIACSRWFFGEAGGFDELFTQYGGEDWEWAHRAWLAGALFAHVPDAVAWHNGPDWAGRDDAGKSGDDAAAKPGDDAAAADAADARARRKNAETLQLAQTIAVRESAPRGVLTARPDVVVTVEAAITEAAITEAAITEAAITEAATTEAATTEAAISEAALFVCLDSVLAAVPHARILVPGPVPEILRADPRVVSVADASHDVTDGARVRIGIQNAVRLLTPDAPRDSRLVWAIEAVGVGMLGEVVFTDEHGSSLLTVASRRAELRRARWGDESLFDKVVEEAPWLSSITSEPSVAGYLGGWGLA